MKLLFRMLLAMLFLAGAACDGGNDSSPNDDGGKELPGRLEPADVEKSNPMKLYAHYMPWFETSQTTADKKWGQHWTMANCNPEQKDADGRRQIASHYYPLIGPYASGDAVVLNYHALLMKYAGLDGAMIDWYGTQDKYDYAANRRNTEAVIDALERAGLKFAIVYEDQTLNTLPEGSERTAQATRDMQYLQDTFFKRKNYATLDGRPLLLIFGPQSIKAPKEWTAVFSALPAKPAFVVLNGHSHLTDDGSNHRNSIGEYLWANPDPASAYDKAGKFGCYIGGAMPGFDDFYKEGGWGNGYTTYPDEEGRLFDRQLAAARNASLDWLQISTWNDFGEGTNIEPTLEYGYRYLTRLQQFSGTSYNEEVLKQIYRWYTLKQQHTANDDTARYLTQAYYYFIALQPDRAKEMLDLCK